MSVVVVVALITLDVIVRGTAATVDGVSYLSMAEGIRQFEFTHWSGAPNGLWPYGYAVALAALGAQARAMIDLGFIIQVAALAGIAVYLVLIARRLAVRRPSAAYLVAAAALLAGPAVVESVPFLESEMLFTFAGLAVSYHVVVQNLLDRGRMRRADLIAGTIAIFLLPNIRFIGVAAALGLALGALSLRLGRDPEAREFGRRACLPIVGGFAGTATAILINLTSTGTLTGVRVPQVDVVRSTVMFSASTFWQLLIAQFHFAQFRYEVAAGAALAMVLVALSVRTARAAWRGGDIEYRRFTVWTWTGIGTYGAILYWRALTTLVDPMSPRFFLPVLPIAVMWLVYSYVVASTAGGSAGVLRADRFAGRLVVFLWLAGLLWTVAADFGRPSRDGDLSAIQLAAQDHACLAQIADAPVHARVSNNAALLWLATDGRLTARQASYESEFPDEFYFIDTRSDAVGRVPAELTAGTTRSVLCGGARLTVELRTRPGGER